MKANISEGKLHVHWLPVGGIKADWLLVNDMKVDWLLVDGMKVVVGIEKVGWLLVYFG